MIMKFQRSQIPGKFEMPVKLVCKKTWKRCIRVMGGAARTTSDWALKDIPDSRDRFTAAMYSIPRTVQSSLIEMKTHTQEYR